MSSMKRFSGNPRKKPNSMGVKKDEYTAHNSMKFTHARYHLHFNFQSFFFNWNKYVAYQTQTQRAVTLFFSFFFFLALTITLK